MLCVILYKNYYIPLDDKRGYEMKNFKIYFTSDVHGYIYPTDYTDLKEKPLGFLNVINQFEKDGNTLIIDGGDTIQGSPFTHFISKKKLYPNPLATVMNAGAYDYIALGNHDFNYGYDYLKSYLEPLHAKALCTNVIDKCGHLPIFPTAIHVLENGLRIGLIGFTTDFIPIWEKAEHLECFDVLNTTESIRPYFDKLKTQVDVMIGIYHGGFECDLTTHKQLSTSSENVAFALCKEFTFDILLTGHQHLPIATQTLFGTHIVQTPPNGASFAKISATYDDGKLDAHTTLIPTLLDYNQKLYDAILPLEKEVQVWLDQPVGFLDSPLLPSDPLTMALHSDRLANFINQVQRDISGADISCCSFANRIKGFEKEVSVRDIVSTYPYPNTLVVLEVSGAVLKAALENVAGYFALGEKGVEVAERFLKPKVAHYNYDYFSGIFYTIDITQPEGMRITSLRFNNREVTPTDSFSLVMNNYRHSGVGGYDMYPSCPVIKEIMIEMPEIIIDYFVKYKHVTVDTTHYLTTHAPTHS